MAMKRAGRYTLVGAAILTVVVLLLLLVLTRTGPGVERAGRFALDQIRGSIDGRLEVGGISSDGLLSGATLHDVSLTDADGRPFVEADSARLAYRLRTLLSGSVVFDRLVVYSPRVIIERLPGEERWNYERIFPSDTTPPDTTAEDGLVLIEDITVHDGDIAVRLPWEPDGPVQPEDTARLVLESVPGGLVRTLRFVDFDARLPKVVWQAPGDARRLIEIRELATRAFVWNTPAEIEALEGVVTIRDSLVSFETPRVRLPKSEVAIVGQVIIGDDENRYDIDVDGQDIEFSDFQWLYPPIPADGGGRLSFRLRTQADGSILWLVRDARLRTPGTELAGSFGVVTGDTVYFTNVDLRASPLDLDLLQQLVPAALPLDGLLIGTVEIEGPVSSLQTRGDAVLTALGPRSRVRWSGTVGLRPPYAAHDLEIDAEAVETERLTRWAPGLRLTGSASGRVRANGSIERGLALTGEVALQRDGPASAIQGTGMFAVGGDRSAFDLRFDARSVELGLLSQQFPGLGRLSGRASGPVTVSGSLDDLTVATELSTPAGGVSLGGRFALTGPVPGYRAEGRVTDFQLHRVARDLPETIVTGRFEVEGEGDEVASLRATAGVDVFSARVAGVAVNRSTARASVADGLLRVDSAVVRTEVGVLRAGGSFGLIAERNGQLAIAGSADRLSLLEPVVFPDMAVAGEGPEVRLAGDLTVSGVVLGSLRRWTARGRASGRDLVYDEVTVGAGGAEFEIGPDSSRIDATLEDGHRGQRNVSRAEATLAWGRADSIVVGRFAGSALGPGPTRLSVAGDFRSGDGVALEMGQLELRTRNGVWASPGPFAASFGPDGLRVDTMVLRRSPDAAEIRIAGSVPWGHGDGSPAMTAVLDRVPVGELLRATQTDTALSGTVSGRFTLSGTTRSPRIDGRLSARPIRYHDAAFDSASGEVRYGDQEVRLDVKGWRGDRRLVHGAGYVPVDLELAAREQRLLDRPMALRVGADSLPAALVAFLMPGFEDVEGFVDGRLALFGTGQSPSLEGELRIRRGTGLFRPLGVRYRDIEGTARMDSGSVVRVDARLATSAGAGRVTGTLDLAEPGDPLFDLVVRGRELEAARRRDVTAVVTGRAELGGRYSRPIVSGDLRIVRGEMNLDEIWRQYQIVSLDPSIFQVMDSAAVAYRPDPESPFLENLRVTGTTLRADRGFWVRSRELNVEVSGSLETEVDREAGDFRLTGTLQAVGGDYALQLVQGVPARIFDIRGGSIEFVGTPGIDPNLDIEARYRVRRAQGDPLDVFASVSGTLQDPRVELSGDADLPLSESDLASYILFGRSGAELTQAQADVVSRGIGLVRPVATGLLSTELQRALMETGLPIDHVALTAPEYGLDQLGTYWQSQGLAGVFHNTQLEVGIDPSPNLSLVGSVRIPTDGATAPDGTSPWRMFGARMEWRFHPSWTTELYVEDRFARTPSFGLSEIDDRKVWGLSLFRDWGY